MRNRGASNSNSRGSSADRARRKLWLLSPEAGHGGDGATVQCAFDQCDAVLTFSTIWVDRFPILGMDGGTYARGNIRPACGPCQTRQGAALTNDLRNGLVTVSSKR